MKSVWIVKGQNTLQVCKTYEDCEKFLASMHSDANFFFNKGYDKVYVTLHDIVIFTISEHKVDTFV